MVGNDVVDLGDIDASATPSHPRFDERVFAASERAALRASGAPERLRWLLWAAKEAAYKLVKKRDPHVIFAPCRFVVELDATLRGSVRYEEHEIPVFFCADGQAVHAIATETGADAGRIVSAFLPAREPRDASREARDLAARTLAERLGVPVGAVHIGRSGRIPTVEVDGRGLDLSLSHHGRFVAFACDLGAAEA
jgi:phosphopantetheinyl transferase (holo-ACP synthase)